MAGGGPAARGVVQTLAHLPALPAPASERNGTAPIDNQTMVDRGFPHQGGPIAGMPDEHATGRSFIRGIAEGAAAVGTNPGAAQRIVENGRGYIGLLRPHINRENHILFPMADNLLGLEDQEHLGKEFERFEAEETDAGVHEAMLKLLEELRVGAR